MTSKPLKVLVLSHSSELGGAERSMIDLFDYWTKLGLVEPHFIIRKPLSNMVPELTQRNWPYYPIHYTNWSQRKPSRRTEDMFRNARVNSTAVAEIEELIDKLKPDMVMTNTVVAPWAAIAAYFRDLPHIWFVREYGDIDHQHIFELGREKMLQDIDTMSDLVVTNSKTLAAHISDCINKAKIVPLYTPFDLEGLERKSQQPVKSPFQSPDSLKLVITGRIAPSKGQAAAAEAVAELNKQGFDTELCVIGDPADPDDAESLNKVIEDNGLQAKIHLIGQQPNPRTLAILKQADVGIMASKQEAFGRVTFEYMAISCPVVGSESGATPELIDNGVNGYLYEPGSVKSLTDRLLNYARDRELVTAHGQAAKQKAEKMMRGPQNADALFEKVKAIAKAGKPADIHPLNFARRWLDYPLVAEDYIQHSKTISVKRLIRHRIRTNLRALILRPQNPVYHKLLDKAKPHYQRLRDRKSNND